MPAKPTLSENQRDEICNLFAIGELVTEIAKQFGVSESTITRLVKNRQVKRLPKPKPKIASGTTIKKFASRARSILWNKGTGKEHPDFDLWTERVEWLRNGATPPFTEAEAIVRASKEFECLHRLFREYDMTGFDACPDSHKNAPLIPAAEQPDIRIEEKELSYREAMRWAINAAGTFLRTGQHPFSCPNDRAFYLYRSAIDEPKDFMSKIGQLELKTDLEEEGRLNARSEGRATVEEIEDFLKELSIYEGEEK